MTLIEYGRPEKRKPGGNESLAKDSSNQLHEILPLLTLVFFIFVSVLS